MGRTSLTVRCGGKARAWDRAHGRGAGAGRGLGEGRAPGWEMASIRSHKICHAKKSPTPRIPLRKDWRGKAGVGVGFEWDLSGI
jgi:hypothetical protein